MKKSKPSIIGQELSRLRNTFGWSMQGLKVCWVEEKSLRQWVVANVFSWGILMTLSWEPTEIVLVVGFGVLTVIVELLNSAIEATVDFVSTEHHELAKKAKDIASGAVMLTGGLWVATWVIIAFA